MFHHDADPHAARRLAARPRLTPLARGLLAACLLSPALAVPPAQAAGPTLPSGLQVVRGQATVSTQGAQMTVRNTPSAILDWQSFSIAAGNRVYFDQAGANSKVLNRVVGNDPSQIFGSLASNGQVWLLNPNGVLFGRSARVDVASLVTSTLRLGDSDFLAGRYRFSSGDAAAATVRNEGALQSSFGGQVVLLGGRVENAGEISAPGGQVALAAASSVDLVDTGLPNLTVRVAVPAGEVLNLGRLAAAGGRVDVYGAIVNQQGLASAETLSLGAQGQIILRASDTLTLGGDSRTEAVGGAGARGGDITLLGRDVALLGQAAVDASGATGGGRIRLGGGLQGKDSSVPNASLVQVDAGSRLSADAIERGNGGQIIVWSDDSTRFLGRISARGGAAGGDGGFAEVSSKRLLAFAGAADLRANQGATGSLLLDPDFLVISAGPPDIAGNSSGQDLTSPNLFFSDYTGATSTITAAAVNSQLASSNVVLQARNDISVVAAINGSNSLTLQAGNNIAVNSSISAAGGIVLSANDPLGAPTGTGAVQLAANLDAGSGTLTITNNGGSGAHSIGGNLSAGSLVITGNVQLTQASTWSVSGSSTVSSSISGSGSLTKGGPGALTLAGANTYSGATSISAGTLAVSGGSALPDASAVSLANTAGAQLSVVNSETIGSLTGGGTSGGNLSIAAAQTLSVGADNTSPGAYAGVISGATGALTKLGSGTLTLSGANTYVGGSTLNGGTLALGSAGAIGAAGTISFTGGALQFSGSNTTDYSSRFSSAASQQYSLDTNGQNVTLASNLASSGGSLTKLGTGTLTLSGANAYDGTTTISAGTLQVGAGGTAGTLGTGAVTDNATLSVNRSNAITLANAISGTGALVQAGAGTTTLTGNSTYTGTTTISAGTLQVGAGGTAGTLGSGAVTDNAALSVNRSDAITLTNAISGTGALVQAGAGTTTLTGNNSYTGGTTISAGTLQVGAGGTTGTLGSGAITDNALLTFNRSDGVTVPNAIGGSGALALVGSGSIMLAGANTYSGTTTISAGTLYVGNGGSSGTLGSGAVVDNASLAFNRSDSVTVPNVISGSGVLGQVGSGTTTLTGANTYTGTTSVSQGTLSVADVSVNGGSSNLGNAASPVILGDATHQGTLLYTGAADTFTRGFQLGAGGGAINNAGTGTLTIGTGGISTIGDLNVSGSADVVISSVIGGSGGLTKVGNDYLTLSADNTFTGTTTVFTDQGRLIVAGSGSTLVGPMVINGGRVVFNNSSPLTLPSLTMIGGWLSGTGDLIVSGPFTVSNSSAEVNGSGNFTTQGASSVDLANVAGGFLGISKPWTNTGTLTVSGDDYLYFGYSQGSGATLTNATGGVVTLNTTAATPMTVYTGTNTFNNAGTLNQSAAGTHTLSLNNINNTGSVNVTAGTLAIAAAGTDSGTYAVASGSTLAFSGGTRTLAAGSNITGAGALLVNGATLTTNAALDLANTGSGITLSSGALNLGGSAGGTFAPISVSGGTLNFNNASAVTLASLSLSGGAVGGSGDIIVSGNFDVTGITANLAGSGNFTTQGTSTVNLAGVNGGYLGLNRNWVNNGTLTVGGDDFIYLGLPSGGTTTLSNAVGATLNLSTSNSQGLLNYSGTTTVNNAGTLNQTAGGSHGINPSNFNNAGTVNLSAGTLTVGSNGSDNGTYSVASGSTLNFSSGTRTLGTGSNITGAGTLLVSGATVTSNAALDLANSGAAITVSGGTLNLGGSIGGTLVPISVSNGTLNFNNASAVTLPSLSITAGTVGGSGDIIVSGNFDVTASYATLAGSGAFTTLGTSTVNLAGVNGGYLGVNRNWVNNGTLTIGGDDFIYLGLPNGGTTTLTNAVGATLNLSTSNGQALLNYSGTTTVNNAGTMNQTAAGPHSLNPTNFNNSGTVNLTAGTLSVSANGTDTGGYAVAAGSTLDFSGGTRTLDVASGVTGAGTLRVSGATVNANGALSLANTGAAIVVSNGTLSLGGAVAGTLAPVSVSGGTLNFNNPAAVTLPSLSLSGGTVGGSGDVTVTGNFDVTGTYANLSGSGAFTTLGTSTVNLAGVNGGYLGLNRNWVNNGTLTLGGDDFIYLGLPNGGTTTLTNAVGATLNLSTSNSQALLNYSGTTTVNNAGTMNQTAAGPHSLNPTNFNNTGTVNLTAGTLSVSASGTDTGGYAVAAGSTLDFSGGTRTLDVASSVTGAGTLRVSGATVNANGAMSLANTGAAIVVSNGTLSLGGAVAGTLVPVSVSGGTLNFNNPAAVTLPSLSLSGGTVGGSGDVTVTGNFDVTGTYATLTGSGNLTTLGTSTVNLGSVNGGYLGVSRNWLNNGTLTLGGDDFIYFGLPSGGASTLSNAAGATLNLSSSSATPMVLYTGSPSVINAGTLNQTATGTHTIGVAFNNTGTVNVTTGTLALGSSGTDSGLYALSAGTTLNVSSGTRTLAAGAGISGTGALAVSGGTLNVNTAIDFSATPVSVVNGTLNFNSTSAVTLPSLSLGGGTVGGTGDVSVSGNFDITGTYATLTGSGSLTTLGTSTVNLANVNGGYLGVSRNWLNNGTLTVGGDDFVYFGLPSGGTNTLSNAAGATLNLSSTAATPLALYTGTQTIVNAGTLNQTATGTHTINLPFNNTGTVNVAAGTLALGSNGTDSGLYALAAGTTLNVSSGTRTLAVGSGISGTGSLAVSGGTLNLNGALNLSATPVSISGGTLNFNSPSAVSVPSLSLSGGTLGGSGDVSVAGAFDALGSYASLTGSGTLSTLGTSTVNLAGANNGYLGVSKAWVNSGTLTLGGDDLLLFGYPSGGNSSLSNSAGGSVNLGSSYSSPLLSYTGTTTISNAGTLNLTAGGAHSISVSSINNTGTVNVLAGSWAVGGTLNQSGQISTNSGTTFQVPANLTNQAGGTLSGSGTFAVGGTLTNQGTISPGSVGGAGTLSVTGNLALTSGTLAIDLGGTGAGASDLLAVSGNATLGGNLNATLIGGYAPVNADFVPIISVGGTASGAFAGTTLPSGFTAGYNLAANEAARLIYAGTGGSKVFTNAANDLNWATPANWSGALPGAADSALISAGYAVAHNTGTDTIAALTVSSANSLNVSGGSLTVTGSTALGGALTVSGSGAATLNGNLTGAGQVNVQGGSLMLNGASSMAGLSLVGGTLGGTGSLNVAGSFSRNGAAVIGPNFSSISVTQTAGNLNPGALSAGALSLTTQDASATLAIDNAVASSGALTITAAGNVQVAGASAALSAAADLNLSAHSVDLAAPVSGNHLVIVGTSGVQLRNAALLTSSASSGDAIVIDAAGSGPFVNTVGATALNTAGGRWLIYSADPSADTVGGLAASFRQYNAPYGSTTPAGNGNGLLYSLAPTLNIGLQGTVSKVYDSTTAASLSAANYQVSGAPSIDSVTLNNPATGVYTSGGTGNAAKDAGSGKTVQVSGLTATVSDSAAGYPVYGIQFNSTASAPVGTITPAPLALTGLSALGKVYDAGVNASLTGTAAVTPLGSDSVALTGSASASFADKNVGNAKPVAVTGFGLSGADAANYALQLPSGLQADITPRSLSVLSLAAADKVYDGSTTAIASAGLGGTLAGDAVSLALNAQFADRNVGHAKPVGVQMQLAGADAGNYLLTSSSATTQASITPATLTYVAAPAASVIGVLPALTGTVTGFVGGDTQAGSTSGLLAWTTPASTTSPAGQYRIDGSGLAAQNYQFTQAPGNATALTLALPITTDIVASASSSTNTSIAQALTVVALPLEMSTPTSGRVLDVMQSLAVGDAAGGSPTYDSVNLSQMQRDEIQSLLAARANFKLKVFGGGISKLLIDPALADVRGCRSVAELSLGNCLLTAALKQDIEAERARAAAQATTQTTLKKPVGRRVMQAVLPTIQRKMALLIGVNAYNDKRIPQLKGAVPDAQAVREVLENHLGYETTVVENPGRDAIVRAFNKLALDAGPDDSVVIYYAGHGVVVPSGKDELGYWVPGDADVDKPESWLSNADIARLVALIGARQVLLISDSCYSGTLAGSERVQLDSRTDAADLLKRKAAVVMSSGGDEPVADIGRDGHSVFAWYLMQTLQKLSNWEVGVSVYDSVRAAVSKSLPQTPQYGASRSAGHQGNTDYLFEQREIEKAAALP